MGAHDADMRHCIWLVKGYADMDYSAVSPQLHYHYTGSRSSTQY